MWLAFVPGCHSALLYTHDEHLQAVEEDGTRRVFSLGDVWNGGAALGDVMDQPHHLGLSLGLRNRGRWRGGGTLIVMARRSADLLVVTSRSPLFFFRRPNLK